MRRASGASRSGCRLVSGSFSTRRSGGRERRHQPALRRLGEQPKGTVEARFAAAVRAGDDIQPLERNDEVAERTVVGDRQRREHRREYAEVEESGNGPRSPHLYFDKSKGRTVPQTVPPPRTSGCAGGGVTPHPLLMGEGGALSSSLRP